jgi:5'-nucleotidase
VSILQEMKRVYIDMDGVLCNFAKARAQALQKEPHQPFPQSQFGFWIDIEPIDGAIEGFNALCSAYDVWILSKPSFDNLNSFSEKAFWVNKYFGPKVLRKLILCGNKSLLIGNHLIDDDTQAGQLDFRGNFIHFGTPKFPDWASVLKYFAFPK